MRMNIDCESQERFQYRACFDFFVELEGKLDNMTLQAGWTVFNMEAIEIAIGAMVGSICRCCEAKHWVDDVVQERGAIAFIV